ncbi:MAG: YigZ family protein [Fidelibacterota bacterium]
MQTPRYSGKGFYAEKGSRFLGFLYPLKYTVDTKTALNTLDLRYKDATHICHASRFYDQEKGTIIELNSDAGEPAGTAGEPILRQLQKNDIINSALYVVRYFGGIKLGKGGLARAYSTCAAQTIIETALQPFILMDRFSLTMDIHHISKVRYIVNKTGGKVEKQINGKNVQLEVIIPKEKVLSFKDVARSITSGKIIFSDE